MQISKANAMGAKPLKIIPTSIYTYNIISITHYIYRKRRNLKQEQCIPKLIFFTAGIDTSQCDIDYASRTLKDHCISWSPPGKQNQ